MKSGAKSKRNLKQSQVFQFFHFLVYNKIQYEESKITINKVFTFIIILSSTFQEFGILLHFYNSYFHYSSESASLKLLNTFCKITLPYLWLEAQDQKLLFLVSIAFLLFSMINLIVLFLKRKQKKKQKVQKVAKTNWIFDLIEALLVYFTILFNYIFFIPFVDVSITGAKENISDNLGASIFSALSLIGIIGFQIYSLITQESVSVKIKNLSLLTQSPLDYWSSLIMFVLLIINHLGMNKYSKFYLIFSCSFLNLFLKLLSQYQRLRSLVFRLVVDAFCLILSAIVHIFLFVVVASESKFQDDLFLQTILILPLCFQFAYNQIRQTHQSILQKPPLMLNTQNSQYRIASLINMFKNCMKSFNIDQERICYAYQFQSIHLFSCENSKCLCKQNPDLDIEVIIQLFLNDEIKHFGALITQEKENQLKFTYFLRYISSINSLGLNSNAFQQSNIYHQEASQFSSSAGTLNQLQQMQERRDSAEQKSSSKDKSRLNNPRQPKILMGKLNLIERARLQVLQDSVKQSINNSFTMRSDQNLEDNLQHAVRLFLHSESNNEQLKRKVMKIMAKKKDFFVKLLSTSQSKFNLFQSAKELVIKMSFLEQKLQRQYEQFPSQKMQALNTFFQAEVRNNYFLAYKLANITSISDEKLLKMQSQTSFDLFSNKIVYLRIRFDEHSHKMQIFAHSNQAHQFFQLQADQFKLLKSIDMLLPQGFSNIHTQLTSEFFATGRSRYFRKIDLNFCSSAFKLLKTVNFFYDMDQTNYDDINMACFFQDFETYSSYIFIGSNLRIMSVTRNIGSKIGLNNKVSPLLFDIFQKNQITKYLPGFQKLHNKDQIDFQEMQNQKFEILNQTQMYIPRDQLAIQTLTFDQQQNQQCTHMTEYLIDGALHFRYFDNELIYYVLEIKEAKLNLTNYSQTQKGRTNDEEMDLLDFDSVEILNEEIVNQPNVTEKILQDVMSLQDEDKFGAQFEIKPNLNISNSYFNQHNSISVLSPKGAAGGKLLGSQTNRKQNQQFFNAQMEIEKSESVTNSDEVKAKVQIENQLDKLQLEDIDEDLQENIRMQMQIEKYESKVVHIDDIGSQVSSIAGIKKSKYFKKYEIIEKLVSSEKFSIKFNLMLGFLISMFLFGIGLSIVIIANSEVDLRRFLQEIDMVQIRSNFMGPVDKYIVSQNAVVNYLVISIFLQLIPIQQAFRDLQYAQKDVNLTYQELKENFDNQLSNPYLTPFFHNKYVVVNAAKFPNLVQYNISIREALNLFKEASYNFALIDFSDLTTIDLTTGYLTYLYSNYETFNELFLELNLEMLDYSVQRSKQVSIEWLAIVIPSFFIAAILMITSFFFYRAYIKQYQRLLDMFSLLDHVWMQRDIDRYKGINDLLMKDSDVLFKYTFDIDLKEKFLAAEDYRKEKIAQKQKNSKSKAIKGSVEIYQTLSLLPSFFFFCLIYSVFFGFTFLSNTLAQNYFQKYPATTNFFNTLSDLSIASSGAFSMRQIIYQIQLPDTQIYFFFEKEDASYFKSLFFKNIEIFNTFLNSVTSYSNSDLLTSDHFQLRMSQLLVEDVCTFLPESKQKAADFLCDNLYGGVLRRGFQESLVKIRDSLLTEYINSANFSLQAYSSDYELEIGLIGYDVVNSLRFEFQRELIANTNTLIYHVTVISSVFISLSLAAIAIALTMVRRYYKWEFKIVKTFILLMPQSSLFLDAQLDRSIRQMIVKENMI